MTSSTASVSTTYGFRAPCSLFNPYRDLEARIETITRASFKGPLSPEDLNDLKKAFKVAHRWIWPAGKLKELLNKLSGPQIKEFLEKIVDEGRSKEALKLMAGYLALCNETQLQHLADWKTAECASRSFSDYRHKRTQLPNDYLIEEGKKLWKTLSREAKYFVHQILNMAITILGLNALRNETPGRYNKIDRASPYEARDKWELYQKILGYPSIIFGSIYAIINFSILAIALTALTIVGVLAFLVAYNRYYKPCPDSCYGLERVEKSKEPIFPRQEILNKIKKAFDAGKKVLLIGKAGAGKTAIINTLAEQVEQKQIYPGIEGVFKCNATDLKGLGPESINLSFIQQTFKNHENEIILFIDEIHNLFITSELQGSLQNELKTITFPFLIVATTFEEKNKYIDPNDDSKAIARRFKEIIVGPLEDKYIITTAIKTINFKAPQAIMDQEFLPYLLEKASEFDPVTPSRIDASTALLNSALASLNTFSSESLENELINLKNKQTHWATELHFSGTEKKDKLHIKLDKILIEIEKKELELKERNVKIAKLKELESQYIQLQNALYRKADPKVLWVKGSPLAKKWLHMQAQVETLKTIIAKKRMELGMPLTLSKALIDSLLPRAALPPSESPSASPLSSAAAAAADPNAPAAATSW